MVTNTTSIYPLAIASIGVWLAIQLRRNRQRDVNLHAITPSPLGEALQLKDGTPLAYPPDLLPGARDVTTPFGRVRAFEFGPIDGPKVLLIHGISTPCISVAPLARQLANRGCRVMTFDLYGRGFSDNPTHQPHSAQLYITETLSVLASSPLSWTGDNGFSLIGYSMGGGIAAAFTDCFPTLVNSLVLIAPAGIVRKSNLAWQKYIMFQTEGLLPKWLIRMLIRRRLNNPMMSLNKLESDKTPISDGVVSELKEAHTPDAAIKPVMEAVRWQAEHHVGFIDAFTSSVRHAPLSGQQAAWSRIGKRLKTQNSKPEDHEFARNGFVGGQLIMLFGNDDAVILSDEVEVDARAIIGGSNMQVFRFRAGHDLPMVLPETVASTLWKTWIQLGVMPKS